MNDNNAAPEFPGGGHLAVGSIRGKGNRSIDPDGVVMLGPIRPKVIYCEPEASRIVGRCFSSRNEISLRAEDDRAVHGNCSEDYQNQDSRGHEH